MRSSGIAGGGAALVAVLIAAVGARADVVPPPPPSCPEGSSAVAFCHGPATCAADICEDDGDCSGGNVCQTRSLCTREHCCSGRCCAGGCGTDPTIHTHVEGPCGAGGSCSGSGTSCESVRVCVPPSSDAGTMDAGGTDGGGSDAGSTDAGGETDAGGTTDAGGESDAGGMDAGDVDAGGGDAGHDAGPGTTGTRDGGCCAGLGSRSDGHLLLLGVVAVAAFLRMRRRAR